MYSVAVWGGGRRQRKEDLLAATVSFAYLLKEGRWKKGQEVTPPDFAKTFLSQYKDQISHVDKISAEF